MKSRFEKLEDWLMQPEREKAEDRILGRIDHLWDDLRDHTSVYLAVFNLDNTDLVKPGEFIMKIGIAYEVDDRLRQIQPGGFELHAAGEFTNRRLAEEVERRLLNDDSYGTRLAPKLKKALGIDTVECKLFTVESYNHMVNTLNSFFDHDPYPHLPEEDTQ